MNVEVRWYDTAGQGQPLPTHYVGPFDFSLLAQGGCESFSLAVPAEYEDPLLSVLLGAQPAVGWRVEFWIDGLCLFRGWVDRLQPAITPAPPSLHLTGSGMMARLSKLTAFLTYLNALGGDVKEVFQKLVDRYLKGAGKLDEAALGGWAENLTTIGHTLKRIEFFDTSLLDAFNTLSDASDQILWGFRVKSTGENEFYCSPLPTTVLRDDFVVTVGKQVLELGEPDDLDWVVNRLKLRGGGSKNPNLITNGSFERILLPGESDASNLLLNPSFEDPGSGGSNQTGISFWTHSSNAIRRPTARDQGEYGRTGNWCAELDGLGDWFSQTVKITVNPTGTTPYLLTTHYALEVAGWGSFHRLVQTLNGAGTVTGTALWAMQVTDSQTYVEDPTLTQDSFSVDSSVASLQITFLFPQSLDKDLNTPPASPAAWDRYVVGSIPTGAWVGHALALAIWDTVAWRFASGVTNAQVYMIDEGIWYKWSGSAWVVGADSKALMLDDVWLDRADRAVPDGWKVVLSNPTVDRCDADWAREVATDGSEPTRHGNYFVRFVNTVTAGGIQYAALLPADDRWYPVRAWTTYEASVWIRTSQSLQYKLHVGFNDLKQRLQPPFEAVPWSVTAADGQWHRYTQQGLTWQDVSGQGRAGLFMQSGTYDVDAFMVREARASMASETDYMEGGQLEWVFDTDHSPAADPGIVAISDWSATAQASIAAYGLREAVEAHEEITTLDHAKRYAKAWLERHCKPRRQAPLTLALEDLPNPSYFSTDGAPSGRIRLEGLLTPLEQFPARVVVKSTDAGLFVEMDLEERRPDPALVLLEYLQQKLSSRGRGGVVSGSTGLVGGGSSSEAAPPAQRREIFGPGQTGTHQRVWDAALPNFDGGTVTTFTCDYEVDVLLPHWAVVDRIPAVEGRDYTVSGAVVTFLDGAKPIAGQRVDFFYHPLLS